MECSGPINVLTQSLSILRRTNISNINFWGLLAPQKSFEKEVADEIKYVEIAIKVHGCTVKIIPDYTTPSAKN